MKDKIQAAFDGIRADEALKHSTAVYLAGELGRRKSANKGSANKGFGFTGRAGVFAAAAVVVLTAAIFSYSLYLMPDAHVSIDVNPSVELTLNKLGRVIDTHAFNGDGERILSGAGLRGKRYDTAAGLLISRMEDGGYFTGEVLVSVTVRAESGDKENLLCSVLQRILGERAFPKAAVVEVFPVSEEVWSHAHGCNMSPAKYLAIQELLEVDEEATLQDYGDSTIPMIRQRAQECRSGHGMAAGEGEASHGRMMGGHMHGGGHGGHR